MATPTALMKATSPDRIHSAMLRAIATPEATQAELAALKTGKDTLDLAASAALEAKKQAIRAQRDAMAAQAAAEAAQAELTRQQAALDADRETHRATVETAAAALAGQQAGVTATETNLLALRAQLAAQAADLKRQSAELAAQQSKLDEDGKTVAAATVAAVKAISRAKAFQMQLDQLAADRALLDADRAQLTQARAQFEVWCLDNKTALANARKLLGAA